MDAGILLSKFINKYLLGIRRVREFKTGRYVCATGFTRAYPRYSKVKFYTDFHKEEK